MWPKTVNIHISHSNFIKRWRRQKKNRHTPNIQRTCYCTLHRYYIEWGGEAISPARSYFHSLFVQINMHCLLVPIDTLATILMKDANSFLRFNKYWLLLSNVWCCCTNMIMIEPNKQSNNICVRIARDRARTPNRLKFFFFVLSSTKWQQGRQISAKNREQQLTCIIHSFLPTIFDSCVEK